MNIRYRVTLDAEEREAAEDVERFDPLGGRHGCELLHRVPLMASREALSRTSRRPMEFYARGRFTSIIATSALNRGPAGTASSSLLPIGLPTSPGPSDRRWPGA